MKTFEKRILCTTIRETNSFFHFPARALTMAAVDPARAVPDQAATPMAMATTTDLTTYSLGYSLWTRIKECKRFYEPCIYRNVTRFGEFRISRLYNRVDTSRNEVVVKKHSNFTIKQMKMDILYAKGLRPTRFDLKSSEQ